MVKKILVLFCVATLVISGIVFYWPHSFAKAIDHENVRLYIHHTENVYDEYGKPKFEHSTSEYEIEPGSKQHTELMDILSDYKYNRSMRALFEESSISWGGNESIQIFVFQGSDYWGSIMNVGAKDIFFGSKKYHLGYWGNKKAQAMLRDIKAILAKVEEE